jgi:hypothetical protein
MSGPVLIILAAAAIGQPPVATAPAAPAATAPASAPAIETLAPGRLTPEERQARRDARAARLKAKAERREARLERRGF